MNPLYGPWLFFGGLICPLSIANARVVNGRVYFLAIPAVLVGVSAANDGVVMGVVS